MVKNKIYVLMSTDNKTGLARVNGTTFSAVITNYFLNVEEVKDSRWVELWHIYNNTQRESSKPLKIWVMGEEVDG